MLNAPLRGAAVDAFKIPDLRGKLLFTFWMLAASRFIAHVPIPGADLNALQRVFQTNQLAGFFDLFSGGPAARLGRMLAPTLLNRAGAALLGAVGVFVLTSAARP